MARFRLTEGRAVHDGVDHDGRPCDVEHRAGDVVESDQDLTLLNTPGRPPRYVLLEPSPAPLDEELLTDEEVDRLTAHQQPAAGTGTAHAEPPPIRHPAPERKKGHGGHSRH